MSGGRSKKSGGQYDEPKADNRKVDELAKSKGSTANTVMEARKRKKEMLDKIMGK